MEQGHARTRGFCLNQLREQNYDRYLASLYLPENIRNLAAALYAFDAEIERISDAISEPMTGEIRIQWWRDTIGSTNTHTLTHNPLADELLAELSAHNLPLASLDTYLQARIFDLYHDPMPDIGTLEGYCGEVASLFFQLLTMAAKFEQNRAIADICGHAGMVSALVEILMAIPKHLAQNRLYIPLEMLESQNIKLDNWFSDKHDEGHLAVIVNMIVLAETHLATLQSLVEKYPANKRDLSLILLPTALCKSYLKSIRKQKLHIFTQIPTVLPIKKHWVFWRAANLR